MKKSFALLCLLVAAGLGVMVDGIVFLPKRQNERYQARWERSFNQHRSGPVIPAAWQNDVVLRRLNPDEWVLAAIYHGGCCPGPEGEFNAMVLLDSRGRISSYNTSPCAGSMEDLASYWKALVPAGSLEELYRHQAAWVQAGE